MTASALLSTGQLAVAPGATTSTELRVRNTSDIVDEFTFQPLGDAADWITVEPAMVRLFPTPTPSSRSRSRRRGRRTSRPARRRGRSRPSPRAPRGRSRRRRDVSSSARSPICPPSCSRRPARDACAAASTSRSTTVATCRSPFASPAPMPIKRCRSGLSPASFETPAGLRDVLPIKVKPSRSDLARPAEVTSRSSCSCRPSRSPSVNDENQLDATGDRSPSS